jgi:hypothetical protein
MNSYHRFKRQPKSKAMVRAVASAGPGTRDDIRNPAAPATSQGVKMNPYAAPAKTKPSRMVILRKSAKRGPAV